MAQSFFCRFLSLPVILYTAERTDARCNGTGRRMCVLFLSEVQNNSIYLTHIPSIPGNKIKPPHYQRENTSSSWISLTNYLKKPKILTFRRCADHYVFFI